MRLTASDVAPRLTAILVVLPLVLVLACGTSDGAKEPEDDFGRVWEAWEKAGESSVGADPDVVVSNTLRRLLDRADAPPYPFLTEVGRLRGQVPPDVPDELADVWRALVVYQQRWPEAGRSGLAEAAISGLAGSREAEDGAALVWEAWRKIEESYADREDLDLREVVNSTLNSLLDLAGAPPYPFLTDVGRMWGRQPSGVPEQLSDVWRALVLHREMWPEFEQSEVVEAAISGMVSGLGDPAAVYLDAETYPEAREALQESLEGSYLGIGARVTAQDGQILLIPFPDTPAESAGIEAGDVLLEVQGEPVEGKSLREVVDQVSGPEGTKVRLVVRRAGEPDPLEIDVFRGPISRPTVSYQLAPGGVGYIYISQFLDNTGGQVFDALESLNRFDMLALILDIRSNPGGSEGAARDIAGQFLPPGSVFLYLEDGHGNRREQRIREDLDRLELGGLPMAVLADEGTIGEAEALAAVLQETGRAIVVGAETFGTAGTYEFVELSDGSAIYLPTLRWYTPGGRLLGGKGIEPDIPVPYESGVGGVSGDSQFNRAYDRLNEKLPLFR